MCVIRPQVFILKTLLPLACKVPLHVARIQGLNCPRGPIYTLYPINPVTLYKSYKTLCTHPKFLEASLHKIVAPVEKRIDLKPTISLLKYVSCRVANLGLENRSWPPLNLLFFVLLFPHRFYGYIYPRMSMWFLFGFVTVQSCIYIYIIYIYV